MADVKIMLDIEIIIKNRDGDYVCDFSGAALDNDKIGDVLRLFAKHKDIEYAECMPRLATREIRIEITPEEAKGLPFMALKLFGYVPKNYMNKFFSVDYVFNYCFDSKTVKAYFLYKFDKNKFIKYLENGDRNITICEE